MNTIILFLFFFLILLPTAAQSAGTCGAPDTCTGTSPFTAASPSFADINYCVNTCNTDHTTPGTVIIPSGSGTWNETLSITRGVILQGATTGCPASCNNNTTITAGVEISGTHDSNVLIHFLPDATAISGNELFRLTGITFDNDEKTNGIRLENMTATVMNKIRIDNNNFINSKYRAMYLYGTLYGSIDNNNFGDAPGFLSFSGVDYTSWDNFAQEYGTANNMYVEDNIFNGCDAWGYNGGGGRYAFRYNNMVCATGTIWNFDAHGNQGVTTYDNASTMVTEIYGNSFTSGSASAVYIFDHRGGWALVHNNLFTPNAACPEYYYSPREEYADNLHGSSYVMKPTNSYYWNTMKNDGTLFIVKDYAYSAENAENCCSKTEAWQANHQYGSAYCAYISGDPNGNCWRVIDNVAWSTSGLTGAVEPNWAANNSLKATIQDNEEGWVNMKSATPIVFNTAGGDIFVQKTGIFDGTGSTGGGVGCGTIASRPATCTTGVGYWATSQDCVDISNYVGANPTTPISGTLYKCNATGNGWDAYYTPYTYPHPLRGQGVGQATLTGGSHSMTLTGGTHSLSW